MTREEINELALDFAVAIRRATLQEAARAVCVNCARGDVPTPTERFIFGDSVTRWRHSPSITKSGEPDYCQADEIYDLIAELDKDGDHE